tara:strand:- start:343 stop:870 length:528 start_codon:yes stop_codon:yes gene_type:complete
MSKESELYDPLNTKTLGGDQRLDVETYENIQDNIHLERVNRKLLELTDLIGRVTNNRSDSGPIPDSQVLVESVVDAGGYNTIFTPGIGEVWQFVGGCANSTTNPTTSVTTELDIYDSVNDRRLLFLDIASSSSSDYPLTETNFAPIYVSYPLVIRQRIEGGWDTATRTYSFVRVR